MTAPWDLVVVGAGPAGACAALAALRARPGARVLLIDAADFPRDKCCGDGVAPQALDVLADLGVPDAADGHGPVDRMRIRSGAGVEVLAPPPRPNRVVPRAVLDARIVAAAVGAGAVLRRQRIREVVVTADGVDVGGERARVVVGADGASSTVRRQLGIPRNPPRALAMAMRGYAPAPVARHPEMLVDMVAEHWPAYAWSFPLEDGSGRANVGYGEIASSLGQHGRAHLADTLAARLPDQPAEPASLRAHHLPLSTWRPRQPDGLVLLAGDAASLVNPLTGEGIFYAVLSGRLAGEAAVGVGDPGQTYRAALSAELGAHLRSTSLLAWLTRHPPLVDAAIDRARRSTAFFDALAEVGLARGVLGPRDIAGVTGRYLRRAPAALLR